MMLTLVIVLIVVTVAYVVAAAIKEKAVPESISAIVYTFGRAGRWTWTAWMFVCAFLLAPTLIEALPEMCKLLGFLTVGSLAFCGAIPLVAHSKNIEHYILGILAGAFSQMSIIFFCWPECLLIWSVFGMGFIPLAKTGSFKRSYVFYIEAFCWCSTITALLIHYM